MASFDMLPEELIARILSTLPCAVRINDCALVCTTWRRLVCDEAAMGGGPCLARHVRHFGTLVRFERGYEATLPNYAGYKATLVDYAASAGHIACLDYCCASERQSDPMEVACMLAARCGRENVLRWLAARGSIHKVGYECRTNSIYAAIRSGNVPCLEYLLSVFGVHMLDRATACGVAASANHVPMLAHVHARGCMWNDATCYRHVCHQAVNAGSLACLIYAHRLGRSLGLCDVRHAIRRGYNDVVMYAWSNGVAPTRKCLKIAALYGNIECFVRAHEAGVPLDACDWQAVVATPHVDIVRYARAHGWVPTQACVVAAARAGRVEMVKCLVGRGVRLHSDALAAAAQSRSLATVRFLHEIGCPWDERVCTTAAHIPNVTMLRYARENGCPWDVGQCRAVSKRSVGWKRRHKALARYIARHSTCATGQCSD